MDKVYHGDCLKIMPELESQSIDLILSDLPYGQTNCSWDKVIPFEPLWQEYKRLIKPKGAIVLTASQPFTSVLVMSNIGNFKYSWVWDKRLGSGHLNTPHRPLKRHEDILVFSFDTPKYYPVMREGELRKKSHKGKNSQCYGKQTKEVKFYTEYHPTSIIEATSANQTKKLHPTQKPVYLFEYLIKTYTTENEVVLDNCAGSGTTAIACLNTNRKYILIEEKKKYIDVINRRITEHQQQLSLF